MKSVPRLKITMKKIVVVKRENVPLLANIVFYLLYKNKNKDWYERVMERVIYFTRYENMPYKDVQRGNADSHYGSSSLAILR